MFPGTRRWHTRRGWAAVCRPRRSGSSRRAGKKGRTFPWGEDVPGATCDRANSRDCQPPGLKPVKAGRDGGKTPEGIYDLAGNVSEWCRDWFSGRYPSEEQTDPLGPAIGSERVLRGGSYLDNSVDLRAVMRRKDFPERRRFGGFRVVWSAAGERR